MKTRKSINNRSQPNVYTALVVEENNTFRLLDTFALCRVNQYTEKWEQMPSRELARKMNRGKLVIK